VGAIWDPVTIKDMTGTDLFRARVAHVAHKKAATDTITD
jgi:hypothetical protein